MKKWIQGLLLMFYLLSTTGIKLHVHFCGEVLSYFEFTDKHNTACACEEESDDMDCCQDQFIQTRVPAAHVAQVQQPLNFEPAFAVALFGFDFHSLLSSSSRVMHVPTEAPPPLPADWLSLIQVYRL